MSKYRSYAMALAIVSTFAVSAFAKVGDEPVSIPLKEIWALDMPGTRNVRELDPPRKMEPRSVIEFIQTSLVERTAQTLNSNNWPKNGDSAGRGFVVVGTDVDALREAHAILSKEKKRADYLPVGKDLSLVFYSYSSGRYVHLDKVERQGDTITVDYHFVSHRTLDMSTHVALIPLGELPVGKVRVRMVQVKDKESGKSTPADNRNARPVVCDSFSFVVTEKKQ